MTVVMAAELTVYCPGRSASSVAIGSGAKVFTLAADVPFDAGMSVTADAGGGDTMTGTVTSYDAATKTLTLSISGVTGSGTHGDWFIGGETVKYLAAYAAFTTAPGDTPANTAFDDRMLVAGSLERHMYRQGRTFGRSEVGHGLVRVGNADGARDSWVNLAFDGRRIVIRRGEAGAAYPGGFTTVITGVMDEPDIGWDIIDIPVMDALGRVDFKPLSPNVYAGTNAGASGKEGLADLKGRAKPRAFGHVRYAEPVLVNPSKLIYQVNDGAIDAVYAVFDRGAALGEISAPRYFLGSNAGARTLGTGWSEDTDAHALLKTAGTASDLVIGGTSAFGGYSGYAVVISFHARVDAGSLALVVTLDGTPATLLTVTQSGYYAVRLTPAFTTTAQVKWAADSSFAGSVSEVLTVLGIPDYANLAALEAAVLAGPGAGLPDRSLATCLAEGLIRVRTKPDGPLTCHAQVTGVRADQTPAAIMEAILTGPGGLSGGDLDGASFATLDALCDAQIGYFARDERTVGDAMDAVAAACGAFWASARDGTFVVGQLDLPPGSSVLEIGEDDALAEGDGIERAALTGTARGLPPSRVAVVYNPVHRVHGPAEIAAAAPDALETILKLPGLTVTATPAHAAATYLLAEEMAIATPLTGAAEAQAEADRLAALYGERRARYLVPLPLERTLGLEIGDGVTLKVPRFGLDAGKACVVIGIVEEFDERASARIELFG